MLENDKLICLNFEVESIIFQNNDSAYAVVSGVLENSNEIIFATGALVGVDVGQKLLAKGYFVQHKFYGRQFKIKSYKQSLPTSELAIRKFLASGAIKGIGPVLCERVVNKFKAETLNVMEKEPEKLLKIKGFSKNLVENLVESVNKLMAMKRLLMFLERFELPAIYGIRVWRKWGVFAIEKIKHNPFVLCEEGVYLSFFDADRAFKSMNLNVNCALRIESAVRFVLKHNALENGHTCAPFDSVQDVVKRLLKLKSSDVQVTFSAMILNHKLFCCNFNGKKFLFLPEFYSAEQYIAQRVLSLANFKEAIDSSTFENLIKLEQKNSGIFYVDAQKFAIFQAISRGVLVLTGGPGTGKTTILKAVISILEQRGLQVAVCAPTGRAAKRLCELTGREAVTIHRLLGVCRDGLGDIVEFVHDQANVLKYDAVVVDEMSMVDCLLFCNLLKALKSSCRLILTGDCNQLPSVSAGNVLKNLVVSAKIVTVELKKIFRQAAKSLIIKNAHAIVLGELPLLDRNDSNFFFVSEGAPRKIADLVLNLVTNRLLNYFSYNAFFDIQVICLFKKGLVGTINLNRMLQSKINGSAPGKAQFKFGFYIYREGDKVMQVKNDYDIRWEQNGELGEGIFNGDVGIIKHIDKKAQKFKVDFDGRVATYMFSQASEIELAYAITVHKSQGNEFKCVVLPVVVKPTEFFSRNLLYTAITRAKENLVLIGTRKSVEFMCQQIRVNYRYSGLKFFLN